MRRVLLIFSLGVTLGACGGDSKEAASSTTTTIPSTSTTASASTTTAAKAGCVPISDAARSRFGVNVTGATVAAVDFRNKGRWYYSTADGATWVSGIDPATGEAGGITVPLNPKARAASNVGLDVPAEAPALRGAVNNSAEAEHSRSCAMP